MPIRIAIEVDGLDVRQFDLPYPAKLMQSEVDKTDAERELMGRGRTYRRPKLAIYAVIEWPMHGTVGRLLDWIQSQPGITRYAELFE